MNRTMAILLPLATVAVVAAGVSVAGQGRENQPGQPTLARMLIINQGTAEAVPVALQATGNIMPVAITAAPAMTLAPNTTIGAHASRQAWEYKQVRMSAVQDLEASLNAAGADGWEALSATVVAGTTTVLLKRPK